MGLLNRADASGTAKTGFNSLIERQRKLILLNRKKIDRHAKGKTLLLEKLLFKHIALLRKQNSLIESQSKLLNAQVNSIVGELTKSRRRSR